MIAHLYETMSLTNAIYIRVLKAINGIVLLAYSKLSEGDHRGRTFE